MDDRDGLRIEGSLRAILDRMLGGDAADGLLRVLVIPRALLAEGEPGVGVVETERTASRAVVAQALNMLLFADLLERVPAAKRYVERAVKQGRTVLHDHGAVRTVAALNGSVPAADKGDVAGGASGHGVIGTGAPGNIARSGSNWGELPAGEESIVRLLRPLGYALHGVYPLERLKMTGRSYAQVDMPEQIAQFFVSELHPERFSQEFQAAVGRVIGSSVDPLTPEAAELLSVLERDGRLPVEDAVRLLPVLVRCFARQHGEPGAGATMSGGTHGVPGAGQGWIDEGDYELLLKESAEMAWIATEGNSFNHVTDRVADVDALAAEQKRLGEPIKEMVERSQSGRVRQTAFLAARVVRQFRTASGEVREREVPGSFLEFITRLEVPGEGKLDLGFDSSNAQAIFKMTAGG
jgi:hypothetical protein